MHLKSHCSLANTVWQKEAGSRTHWVVTAIFSLCLTEPKPPCWKTLYLWFCGLSPSPTSTLSQEEKAALERRLTSIEEKPLWKTVCNVNALLLLTINVFLWGYFG